MGKRKGGEETMGRRKRVPSPPPPPSPSSPTKQMSKEIGMYKGYMCIFLEEKEEEGGRGRRTNGVLLLEGAGVRGSH